MFVLLNESLFEDDVYSVDYGSGKKAIFSIVEEEILGKREVLVINRVNIVTECDGVQTYRSSIIGVGDSECVITSEKQELEGKVMNRSNMSDCLVYLNDESEA